MGAAVWPGCRREWCTQPALLYCGPEQLCKRPIWRDHGRALGLANAMHKAALESRTRTFVIGGDIEVRRVGFGAMRITGPGTWGPPPDRAASRALLRRAVELGVQRIDTADAYGPGVSEELIAEALAPYDGVLIATKGGYERSGPSSLSESGELTGWTPNGRPDHLRSACEASLRRLRLDRIDLSLRAAYPRPSRP